MEAFFKNIFAYHRESNQKLIEQLIEVEAKLPDRTVPLFSHALNAQQIWNARITGGEAIDVFTVHPLDECDAFDLDNYQETLRIIDNYPNDMVVSYSNFKGDVFQNSLKDILFHINNHFTHHRGQIISDIRQSGPAPIITDYIFYKRQA